VAGIRDGLRESADASRHDAENGRGMAYGCDLDRGLMPDWCNPQWLLALALKIEKIGGAA
jgi:hypothetical protein